MSAPLRVGDLTAAGQALARLVPQVYLTRDAGLPDRPLLRLLEVLAGPLAELDAGIDQLLDDHFAERARAEVLPLIAELVGARLLGTDTRTNRGVIAATVGWRRRKGTVATLEEVLHTTTGWATEVDEAARSVLATQDLDDLLLHRGRSAELTDPIALADPLSRRAAEPDRRAGEAELGAADALRPAVSPRTLDLDGWVRPEQVVVRSSRLSVREIDRQEIVQLRAVRLRGDPAAAPSRFIGLSLDPRGEHLDRDGRPVPFPLAAATGDLLGPSALAFDGELAADHDVLTVFTDGVPVIGGPAEPAAGQPLQYLPPGPLPVLRPADADRPGPGERWLLQVLALDRPDLIDPGLLDGSLSPPVEVGADNPVVLQTTAGPGGTTALTTTPAGLRARAGAQVAVRVQRVQSAGYGRTAGTATWEVLATPARRGHPVSPVLAVTDPAGLVLVRVQNRPGADGLELERLRPDEPAADWQAVPLDLPGLDTARLGDVGDTGPLLSGVDAGDAVLIAGPVAGSDAMAVWRVAAPGTTGPGLTTGVRIDGPASGPSARVLAGCCLAAGRLWLYGGQQRRAATGAVPLADLWSIDVTGPAPVTWTRHRTRHAPPRTGARLLPLGTGLAILGGAGPAETGSGLATEVLVLDPAAARPVWTPLPALPFEPDRPGVLWARADGPALEVVAWPDRARPRTLRLPAGERSWIDAGPDAGDSPNPPAEGDAVFAGERLLVPGPVPLPPSELLISVGGQGQLVFLPALDPPDGAADLLLLDADGSTQRWLPPGTLPLGTLRLAAGRAEEPDRRIAPGRRIGVPGRLGRREFQLRQCSLGPWTEPIALTLDGVVGLDPRLGRVLFPRAVLAGGRASASYRTARVAALGAGFAEPGRALVDDWSEPPDRTDPQRWVPAVAPELDPDLPLGPAPVTAFLDPPRAGELVDGVPRVARPADAIRPDATLIRPGVRAQVIAVPGSPRLEPATLTVAQGDVLSMFGSATGAVPHFAAEDGVSLQLQERLAAGEDPEAGPSWFLTGLSTDGAVELLVGAGQLDLRWCDLGLPRRDDPGPRTGVRVIGAGAGARPRWPLPATAFDDPGSIGAGSRARPVVLRLIGCLVGRLEVPPWVQVIAAGCGFDAGSDDGEAIAATGAALRLRQCTVRGVVTAGQLEASSSLFRGRIDCDRPDRSWLRHCGLDQPPDARTGRSPLRYASVESPISLVSLASTSPQYLLPDDNNSPALLAAGEHGLQPGAHGRRARGLLELTERSSDFLPFGLVPHHVDRAAADLQRMNRRLS